MSDLIERIEKRIKEIEASLGLDWRSSYVNVTQSDRSGGIIEVSSRDLFEALSHQLVEGAGPEGEFQIEHMQDRVTVRLLAPLADERLWVATSVADVRREPSHTSELVSQAVMGEDAAILRREGDWYLIVMGDGYHGWMRSWYALEASSKQISAYRNKANAMVIANVAYVRESAAPDSMPVTDLVAGTCIEVDEVMGGYRRAVLPSGKQGFAPETDIIELKGRGEPSRDRIISRAMRFIGIPYLWGGTTTKGFDCSGLVKRVYQMEGIELPRDSDQQALVGEQVVIEDALPGELLFFGEGEKITHVAIYLSDKRFIHAYGEVRINSLLEEDELFEPKLAPNLRIIRRII
jgi:uncharacterized protein YgiM (DUF1202 family)